MLAKKKKKKKNETPTHLLHQISGPSALQSKQEE